MKSKEFFEMFIADLTELEMTDLLESCNELIDRNKWAKLREQVFTDDYTIDVLESKMDDLADDNDRLERMNDDIQTDANRALECLVDGKIDEAKKILANI